MSNSIQVNAKINLCLDVKSKREDGYHEIESLLHSIGVSDTLTIKKADKKTLVSNNRQMPLNEKNLVLKAITKLEEELGTELNCAFNLEKRIPISAGLGGGSADAAGALILANHLFDLRLSLEELAGVAAKVGADVPFMLYGGSCLVSGIGDVIERSTPAPSWGVLLIKPPFGIRTKSAYDLLDASEDLLHFDPTKLEQAIERRNYHEAKKNLGNTFTKPIVEQCPSLSIIMETLDELGIGAVSLSGSGPTLFALTEDSGIIEELEAKLEKKIPNWQWTENRLPYRAERRSEPGDFRPLVIRGRDTKPWIHFARLTDFSWQIENASSL